MGAQRSTTPVVRRQEKARTENKASQYKLDVLHLIAHGMSNRQIAEELVLAELTVRTHVNNILSKLHLASRTQAALHALEEGLASLDDVPPLKGG
jgi:NarL family two-component system response regulator LiaR